MSQRTSFRSSSLSPSGGAFARRDRWRRKRNDQRDGQLHIKRAVTHKDIFLRDSRNNSTFISSERQFLQKRMPKKSVTPSFALIFNPPFSIFVHFLSPKLFFLCVTPSLFLLFPSSRPPSECESFRIMTKVGRRETRIFALLQKWEGN